MASIRYSRGTSYNPNDSDDVGLIKPPEQDGVYTSPDAEYEVGLIPGLGGDFYLINSNIQMLAIADYQNPSAFFVDFSDNTGKLYVYGHNFNDILYAGSNDDYLSGGTGADRMTGGKGDDLYVVDNAGDVVREFAGAGTGTDTVYAAISYTLADNVENGIVSGTGTVHLTGNRLDNTLTGNGANNILNGRGGADTMKGGLGNDVYLVDNAGDQVVERAGQGFDTVKSYVSYSLEGQGAERLALYGAGEIDGTGNAFANILLGNSGANTLSGGDGNDVIAGKGGADTLIGGNGADFYVLYTVADSTVAAPDFIDLRSGDTIDISPIDADTSTATDDYFIPIGTNPFSGKAGQLRYEVVGLETHVSGDVNGDAVADFMIRLGGRPAIDQGEFWF